MRHKEQWNWNHKGIDCEIIHHGVDPIYNPNGIWCYYIYVSNVNYTKDNFESFCLRETNHEFNGSTHYSTSYEEWDYQFHGGSTYGEIINHRNISLTDKKFPHHLGNPHIINKVGCDFNHLWDEGMRYNLEYVKRECENSVEAFLKEHPFDYIRCSYTGIHDVPENFYTSKNGFVHNSVKLLDDVHDNWKEIKND